MINRFSVILNFAQNCRGSNPEYVGFSGKHERFYLLIGKRQNLFYVETFE